MNTGIPVRLIKEKSKALKIPYDTLLLAAAREYIVAHIFANNEGLYLKRHHTFGLDNYSRRMDGEIYLSMVIDVLDEDAVKDIISKITDEDIKVFNIDDSSYRLHVTVSFDKINIPVPIIITKGNDDKGTGKIKTLKLLYENDEYVDVPCYSKERELAEMFANFSKTMELTQDMALLESMYVYGTRNNLDGRLLGSAIENMAEEGLISIDRENVKHALSALLNKDMASRYDRYLKGHMKKGPSYEEVRDVMLKLYHPVLDSLLKGQVFFGDWIKDVRRYL